MNPRPTCLLLAATLVALAVACGGGGGDAPSSTPTPPPAGGPLQGATDSDLVSPSPQGTPTATPTATAVPVVIANGTVFTTNGAAGIGILIVHNDAPYDAVVKLRDAGSGATVRSFYVTRESDWQVADIPPGNYDILFASGTDWDPVLLAFQHSRRFFAFEDPFPYEEVTDASGATTYQTWEVTFNTEVGGGSQSTTVSAEDFGAP
jgi:hypothetical protein